MSRDRRPWRRRSRLPQRLWAAVTAAAVVLGAAVACAAGSEGTATSESAAAPTGSASGGLAATAGSLRRAAGVQRLAKQLAALQAANADIEFAVAVADHQTGQTYERGGTTFVTASIVKVEILATLLLQRRSMGLGLTSSQLALATRMICYSDNDAADALWSAVGGASAVAATGTAFGLSSTTPNSQGVWGRTTTTAADQVRLLDAIADPSGPLGADNAVLLELMESVTDEQDWGVSAAARAGEITQLKNGWVTVGSDGGAWTINSIGRIQGEGTALTLAILSSGHSDLGLGISFVETIASMVRAAIDPVT